MARSYYLWLITLEDDTELYVIANRMSQILYSDRIEDIDEIIKIEQLELADRWAEDLYENVIILCPKD